ncbi:MAG: ATP:cob(I)alamin adenosyltransferase [Planctomycetes bacterium RBG_16_43_13]|nr:MAG: ATP:cob(I)alamin adenosyltransferase [Planctomycetes bacterium RBG_16_43_13]
MRITKVITKTGDNGTTGLVGGKRVSKASPRVAAYGDADELNSFIGLLRAFLRERPNVREREHIDTALRVIQEQLFVVGSDLSTPLDKEGLRTTSAMTVHLEQEAEEFGKGLDALEEFILPTGDIIASLFHVVRTITRRVERQVVKLQETEKVGEKLIIYLNRLSDFLFILGRFYTKVNSVKEDMIDFDDISRRFKDSK